MSSDDDLHGVLDRLVARDVSDLPDSSLRADLLLALSGLNRLSALAAELTAAPDVAPAASCSSQ